MTDNSGPAFPCDGPRGEKFSGISTRDLFAVATLIGEIISMQTDDQQNAFIVDRAMQKKLTTDQLLAERSYDMADTMLTERRNNDGRTEGEEEE